MRFFQNTTKELLVKLSEAFYCAKMIFRGIIKGMMNLKSIAYRMRMEGRCKIFFVKPPNKGRSRNRHICRRYSKVRF